MATRRNSITVSWKGLESLDRSFQGVHAKVVRGAVKALHASALLLASSAKRLVLKGPKTGRIYGNHQASAPDEAPASDTGTLVRNIVPDTNPQALEASVTAGTKYAKWLEYGTRLMGARPFLTRALQESVKKIRQIFASIIRGELRG